MADEAIIVELLGNGGDPIRYTCDDTIAIAKGSLLELTSPRTVIQSTLVDEPIAGIAATEKVANDGQTSIAVYTNGIFIMKCATTQCEIGDTCSANATDNNVTLSTSLDRELGWDVGVALQTIAPGASGMIKIHK